MCWNITVLLYSIKNRNVKMSRFYFYWVFSLITYRKMENTCIKNIGDFFYMYFFDILFEKYETSIFTIIVVSQMWMFCLMWDTSWTFALNNARKAFINITAISSVQDQNRSKYYLRWFQIKLRSNTLEICDRMLLWRRQHTLQSHWLFFPSIRYA